MRLLSSFKRLVYLTHRWTGVFACLLMTLWFISGITMLFVGYPKLTPDERLAALPPLSLVSCCAPVQQTWEQADKLVLSTVAGQTSYLLSSGKQVAPERLSAIDGQAMLADPATILQSARQFLPGVGARYVGLLTEDKWTHARSLDPHRPLHIVEMEDASRTRLYLSSHTGQVVLDAPRAQQTWNYIGAWLHWLYVFRDTSVDPGWHWLLVVLSAIGTLSALSGMLAGLWRWRFKGRYKSGSRSPYRAPSAYWHHLLGLAFSGFLFAWILSGLASMNPLGIFSPQHETLNVSAMQGSSSLPERLRHPAPMLFALVRDGFQANELEWRHLAGHPYVLARSADNRTRIVVEHNNRLQSLERLPDAWLLSGAAHLLPQGIAHQEWMTRYDAHYYARQAEAMNGAAQRRLPVWRLSFSDPAQTQVYLDPYTGDIVLSTDTSKREGRWWFNLLHSWDLPGMLDWPLTRLFVLIALSLGGLGICLTSCVIAWKRLRLVFR